MFHVKQHRDQCRTQPSTSMALRHCQDGQLRYRNAQGSEPSRGYGSYVVGVSSCSAKELPVNTMLPLIRSTSLPNRCLCQVLDEMKRVVLLVPSDLRAHDCRCRGRRSAPLVVLDGAECVTCE